MLNVRRKFKEDVSSKDGLERLVAGPVFVIADTESKEIESPARVLQARLSDELQPVLGFEARHPALAGLVVFATACASTWIFGALLYAQL